MIMRILLTATALFPLTLFAQQPDPAITELRETISKIVDVRTLESEERLDWEARKAEMAALLDLHRRELALLGGRIEPRSRRHRL